VSEVTVILERLHQGDGQAAEELLPLVYAELKRLAAYRMSRESPNQTLQPTALVHEAWLRLVGDKALRFNDRAHFVRAASEAMRRILIESARRRRSLKRGGDLVRVDLDDIDAPARADDTTLLRIDDALKALAREDEASASLVNLRFFGGMTLDEAAQILGVSERTAKRYWSFARAWLYDHLKSTESPAGT